MMLPRAAGDEETPTREGGGEIVAGLDLLGRRRRHGFLLPPPTTTTTGHGGSAYDKTTGFDDEPLRFGFADADAAASETLLTAARPQPRPVDFPAAAPPPAMSIMPKQHAQASSSPKLGSFRGVRFQVPSTTDELPRASPPVQPAASCPGGAASVGGLFFGSTSSRPPPVDTAAGPGRRRLVCFEGSASASAAAAAAWTGRSTSTSTHDDEAAAPMTILYAGSVRAYDGVTMEQAEKIMAVVAKEARAAGIQAAEPPQLQLAVAAAPTATGGSDVALMTMHYWRLAHHHVNDSLKRTASLARFLDKRKQRAESSAAAATIMHHPRRDQEWLFPAQIMDASAPALAPAPAPAGTVPARTTVSLGAMDRWRPRASQDHHKRMKAASHGDQEAVSTELRI